MQPGINGVASAPDTAATIPQPPAPKHGTATAAITSPPAVATTTPLLEYNHTLSSDSSNTSFNNPYLKTTRSVA